MYSGLSARSLSGGEAEGADQVGNFQATLSVAKVFCSVIVQYPFPHGEMVIHTMANISTSLAHSIMAGAKERETAKL